MAKKFPLHPSHPERICWGCDRYCPADSLACGNGADRTMHPAEMIGDDWYLHGDWGIEVPEPVRARLAGAPAARQADEGVAIACEVAAAAAARFAGCYVLPAFNHMDGALAVCEAAQAAWTGAHGGTETPRAR